MTLYLETFEVARTARRGGRDRPAAGRAKNGNRLEVVVPRGRRDDARGPDQGAPDPVQPPQQREQVHRAGRDPAWRPAATPTAAATGSPSGSRDTGIGMTPGADGPALPGVHPGGRRHDPEVRGHRARPGDQPPVLPDDGRRHHRGERRPAGARPSPSPCRSRSRRPPRPRRRRPRRAATPAGGRRPRAMVLVIDDDPAVPRPDAARPRPGRLQRRRRGQRPRGARAGPQLRPAAITLDVMMPGMDGWAVLAALKADPELAGHPRRDAHDRGRPSGSAASPWAPRTT